MSKGYIALTPEQCREVKRITHFGRYTEDDEVAIFSQVIMANAHGEETALLLPVLLEEDKAQAIQAITGVPQGTQLESYNFEVDK